MPRSATDRRSDETLAASSILGKYEILGRLATGGMAELFLGTSRGIAGFRKPGVLKCLLPHMAAEPRIVRMFLDEARLAARLHHPNVAQVYDIGSVASRQFFFFAMEYVHGESVLAILQRAAKVGARTGIGRTCRSVAAASPQIMPSSR